MWQRTIGTVVLVCAAVCGCSRRNDPLDGAALPGGTPGSIATGSIRGTVRFVGAEVPAATVVANTTDPQACDPLQPVRDLVVDPQTGGVANAIVALRGVPAELTPTAAPQRLVLANRDCQFVPHVAVLTVGGTIEAVNHDGVLHTAHLYGAIERNLALPDESATMTATATTPGMVSILCDVHGWMKAFIRVDAHPFHAVTDSAGAFLIEKAPVGEYDLDVWHERLGSRSVRVRVPAGATPPLEIEYELERSEER